MTIENLLENAGFRFDEDMSQDELKYLQSWLAIGRCAVGYLVANEHLMAVFAPSAVTLAEAVGEFMTENEDLDKGLTRKLFTDEEILAAIEEPWND